MPAVSIAEMSKWGLGALLALLVIGLMDQLCVLEAQGLAIAEAPIELVQCIDWDQTVLETVPLGWVFVGFAMVIANRIRARRNLPPIPLPETQEGNTNETNTARSVTGRILPNTPSV